MDETIAAAIGPRARVMRELTIRVLEEPVLLKESGDLAIDRPADAPPGLVTMLILDAETGAYRPVLVPPGSAWEFTQKRQGPALWTPGMLPGSGGS